VIQWTCAKGYAVLQTSLQLNSSLLPSTNIKEETVDSRKTTAWSAKQLWLTESPDSCEPDLSSDHGVERSQKRDNERTQECSK
jgi:hypothetical protein